MYFSNQIQATRRGRFKCSSNLIFTLEWCGHSKRSLNSLLPHLQHNTNNDYFCLLYLRLSFLPPCLDGEQQVLAEHYQTQFQLWWHSFLGTWCHTVRGGKNGLQKHLLVTSKRVCPVLPIKLMILTHGFDMVYTRSQ